MRVAVDTNRYVDLCKGVTETVALLEEAEAVILPFVVLAELRAGFVLGRRHAENERVLRRFLLKDGVRVLFGDGWGLIRASNTQPVLVMRFEARTKEQLEKIQSEMQGWLRAKGVKV